MQYEVSTITEQRIQRWVRLLDLDPSLMAEVFVTKDVPYNLRDSNNLALPRARKNLYGIDAIRFVGHGRLCQEKSKSPNHWRFLKEILNYQNF